MVVGVSVVMISSSSSSSFVITVVVVIGVFVEVGFDNGLMGGPVVIMASVGGLMKDACIWSLNAKPIPIAITTMTPIMIGTLDVGVACCCC